MIKSCKRPGAFFLMLIMVICIAECGNSQGNDIQEQTAQDSTSIKTTTYAKRAYVTMEQISALSENTTTDGNSILVVYFSRTGEQYSVGVIDEGNTAIVAKMIADKTGAGLFEILPVDDHYPMTYNALTDVTKQEQNDDARPEYAGTVPDLSQYSTIFVGAPVWWGDWPMIMYTFFEKNADALAGKRLLLFSTHEGSGLSGFDTKLGSVCPKSTILDGLAVRGSDCQNKQESVRSRVYDWIAGLGY